MRRLTFIFPVVLVALVPILLRSTKSDPLDDAYMRQKAQNMIEYAAAPHKLSLYEDHAVLCDARATGYTASGTPYIDARVWLGSCSHLY